MPKIIFYFFILLLLSCTQVTEIALPEPSKLLVINGFFCPDSAWKIQISVPDKVSNPTPILAGFEGANVELWEEGVSLGKLQPIGQGYYSLPNQKPKLGKHYTIQAAAVGYPTAEAESYVPDSVVNVISAGVDWNNAIPTITIYGEPTSVHNMKIDFVEPQGKGNFYYLSFYYYDSLSDADGGGSNPLYPYKHPFWVIPNDPVINPLSSQINYILFNDIEIEGNRHTLRTQLWDWTKHGMQTYSDSREPNNFRYISIDPPKENYLEVYADFQNVSPEMYQFIASYYVQARNFTDPFAIYSNVYSNVTGGRGIFAGYTSRQVLIFKGKIGY